MMIVVRLFGFSILLFLVATVHSINEEECQGRDTCVGCVGRGNVWCSISRQCVSNENECTTENNAQILANIDTTLYWFRIHLNPLPNCSPTPRIAKNITECPVWSVEVDHDQADNVFDGSVVSSPKQPRLIICNNQVGSSDPYEVGGFVIDRDHPERERKSKNQPRFFFLSHALDKVFDAFNSFEHLREKWELKDQYFAEKDDRIRMRDMTIVAPYGDYFLQFIVGLRVNNNTNEYQCAYSQPVKYHQRPQARSITGPFRIGIPFATLGIIFLFNFMLWLRGKFYDDRVEWKRNQVTQEETDDEIEMVDQGLSPIIVDVPKNQDNNDNNNNNNNNRSVDPSKKTEEGANSSSLEALEAQEKKKKEAGNNGDKLNDRAITSFAEYIARLKEELKNFWRAIFILSDKDIVERKGAELYYYLYFHKLCLAYVCICTVIVLPILLPVDLLNPGYDFFGDFAATTVANLEIGSPLYYVHVGVGTLMVLLALGFFFMVKRLAKYIVVADVDKDQQTDTILCLFTVQIRGIRRGVIDSNLLLEHFNELYGNDNVVCAYIAPDISGLTDLTVKKVSLEKKLVDYRIAFEQHGKRPTLWLNFWNPRKRKEVDAIENIQQKLKDLEQQITVWLNTHPRDSVRGTSTGFVTFASIGAAAKCVKEYQTNWWWFLIPFKSITRNKARTTKHSQVLGSPYWKVKRAPDPDQVLWANLHYTTTDRVLRWIAANVGSVVVLFLLYFIVFSNSFFQLVKDNPSTSKLKTWIYEGVGSTFAKIFLFIQPEIVGLVNEIIGPLMSATIKAEKHISTNGERSSKLQKTIFLTVLNSLVVSRFWWFLVGWVVLFYASDPFKTYHWTFNTLGISVMKFFIVQSLTSKGIQYLVMIVKRTIKFWISHRMSRPSWNYEGGYAKQIMILITLIIYGSFVPLVLPVGIAYFISTYWIEKWVIINLYKRSEETDGKLLEKVADNGVVYTMVLFCIFTITVMYPHFRENPLAVLWIILIIGLGIGVVLSVFWVKKDASKAKQEEEYNVVKIIVADDTEDEYRTTKLIDFIGKGFHKIGDKIDDAVDIVLKKDDGVPEEDREGPDAGKEEEKDTKDEVNLTKVAKGVVKTTFTSGGETVREVKVPRKFLERNYKHPLEPLFDEWMELHGNEEDRKKAQLDDVAVNPE